METVLSVFLAASPSSGQCRVSYYNIYCSILKHTSLERSETWYIYNNYSFKWHYIIILFFVNLEYILVVDGSWSVYTDARLVNETLCFVHFALCILWSYCSCVETSCRMRFTTTGSEMFLEKPEQRMWWICWSRGEGPPAPLKKYELSLSLKNQKPVFNARTLRFSGVSSMFWWGSVELRCSVDCRNKWMERSGCEEFPGRWEELQFSVEQMLKILTFKHAVSDRNMINSLV